MSVELILYSTSACHLCEQALQMLQPLLNEDCRVQEVDISESEALFQRYGLLIPVLYMPATGAELQWPFSLADAQQFIKK
jgi:hypothetical protein